MSGGGTYLRMVWEFGSKFSDTLTTRPQTAIFSGQDLQNYTGYCPCPVPRHKQTVSSLRPLRKPCAFAVKKRKTVRHAKLPQRTLPSRFKPERTASTPLAV